MHARLTLNYIRKCDFLEVQRRFNSNRKFARYPPRTCELLRFFFKGTEDRCRTRFICRHAKNFDLEKSAFSEIFYCAILRYPGFFPACHRAFLVFREFTWYPKNPRYVHSEYRSFFSRRGYPGLYSS